MSDTCPKCGAEYTQTIRGYRYYACNSSVHDDVFLQTSVCEKRERIYLRSRLKQMEKERDRLQAENADMRDVVDKAKAENSKLRFIVNQLLRSSKRIMSDLPDTSGMMACGTRSDIEYFRQIVPQMEQRLAALKGGGGDD